MPLAFYRRHESNHTESKITITITAAAAAPHNEWERNRRFEVHGVSEPVRHDLITAGSPRAWERHGATGGGGRVRVVGWRGGGGGTSSAGDHNSCSASCASFAFLPSSLTCRHFYYLLLLLSNPSSLLPPHLSLVSTLSGLFCLTLLSSSSLSYFNIVFPFFGFISFCGVIYP